MVRLRRVFEKVPGTCRQYFLSAQRDPPYLNSELYESPLSVVPIVIIVLIIFPIIVIPVIVIPIVVIIVIVVSLRGLCG